LKGKKMPNISFQDTCTATEPTAARVIVSSHRPSESDDHLLSLSELRLLKNKIEREDRPEKETEIFSVDTETRRLVWCVVKSEDPQAYTLLGGRLYAFLKQEKSVVIGGLTAEQAYETAFGLTLRSYRFDKYVTTRENGKDARLTDVLFAADHASLQGYQTYAALADGVFFARNLTNEPSNKMTPIIMAEHIRDLSACGLEVDVLDENDMLSQNFNLAMAVAQGSANPPRIAVIKWHGKKNSDRYDIGLVGKGVTFDSGGISIKPAANMWDMKQDMAGAAAMVAAMKTAAMQKLPINAVAVVGLVENMPSGTASRPGDIVRSMSGQTVEILNTDAEGRLVLADCLWYIQEKYDVKKVVDMATLTGAIVIALGHEMAGLMSNDQPFADQIFKAGQESGEQVWQLPMNKNYDKLIDSDVADMQNICTTRQSGSITAACFLNRFIRKGVAWAHLDIAGMDKAERETDITPKGASGFGVRLINRLMRSL
jgi:leucyl aminopeptidase